MKKNNLIRFAQSLVFLPVMAMSVPTGNIPSIAISRSGLVQQLNITVSGALTPNQVKDPKAEILKAEAGAIDAYFAAHDMPLAGMGMKMAEEADANGLDWRLLPAIAVRESSGGKNACNKNKHNAFGWGSCKIGFKSDDEAIETIAQNLGGNNPGTAFHYDNKTTKQILRAYNPPSIVPKYADQVISIMNSIGALDMTPTLALNS